MSSRSNGSIDYASSTPSRRHKAPDTYTWRGLRSFNHISVLLEHVSILPGLPTCSTYVAFQHSSITAQVNRQVRLEDFSGDTLFWQRVLGHGRARWGFLHANVFLRWERYCSRSYLEVFMQECSAGVITGGKRKRKVDLCGTMLKYTSWSSSNKQVDHSQGHVGY